MFRDDTHMEKVIDGAIGDEMLKKLTEHPTADLIGLCWMNAGTRNVYNSKKPIKTIEDLKGLKIRMMGNPVFVDTMNALGGNGVAMGFDQLTNALQTGIVDGAENNEPSLCQRRPLPPRQILLLHRPSHPSRNSRDVEEGSTLSQGRPDTHHESREGSAAGAARPVAGDRFEWIQSQEAEREAGAEINQVRRQEAVSRTR